MAYLKLKGKKIHIKYYDKISGKHKEFSTGINATKEGWAEAKRLLKQFKQQEDLNEKYAEMVSSKILSEGIREFLEIKRLKPKTIEIYNTVRRILIDVCGDKNVKDYGQGDYKKILLFFDKKNYSRNTQGIYSSHMHTLFEYFKEMNYLQKNPIKVIKRQTKQPESIDDSDLQVILRHLYVKGKKEQYYLIMFLLITGFRISSALELRWENVDWENEFIVAPNVKKDRTFFFPITEDLKELLKQIGIKKEGRIFSYSRDGLKFYWRLQKQLLNNPNGSLIKKMYSMHQLRKTFITKLLEKGVPVHTVKALADHSNISTTINYYASVNVKKMKEELDRKGIFAGIFGGEIGGGKEIERTG